MKVKNHVLIILLFASVVCYSQSVTKYGVTVVNDTAFYHHMVNRDSLNKLVDLEKFIPGIKTDIRYATSNNFLGTAVYPPNVRAYLRLPAAIALKKVQEELNKKGLGLKIYDAYRPYSVTVIFWDKVKDTNFVSSPWQGSRHNRGCAVDLTIINLKTGNEIEMPTQLDDFSAKAHPDYNKLPDTVKANRALLFKVMTKYGFRKFATEWWHFDFSGWENYFLMDLRFDQLEK